MSDLSAATSALNPFFDNGLVDEVLYVVKSGKEATVFCCRSGPAATVPLLAAKIYHSRERRNFKNDSLYREGRVITNSRDRRAAKRKSSWGRGIESMTWLESEYGSLIQLRRAGADVPLPVDSAVNAVLMEYLGDQEEAAPQLRAVTLKAGSAHRLFERVMANLEIFLSCDLVHGDLSPYNILYWKETAWVIDFPQAVNARQNRRAFELLGRDIENVCGYFERFGVRADPGRLTRALWARYQRAELG